MLPEKGNSRAQGHLIGRLFMMAVSEGMHGVETGKFAAQTLANHRAASEGVSSEYCRLYSVGFLEAVKTCENHPDTVASGVTGNGELYCDACLIAGQDYADLHIPEDAVTFALYRSECALRLAALVNSL